MEAQKKQANDIRVGFNSRISGIVNYCQRLLKENNMRELNFSAVGGSIGTLVTAVEVLKTLQPGFHQVNRLATISYQSVEEGKKNEVQNQKLYPKQFFQDGLLNCKAAAMLPIFLLRPLLLLA